MSEMKYAWVSDVHGETATIYMGCPYQQMLATHDGSQARLLKCSARAEPSYLPMLVKDLGGGQKEAYSAYGYGGLLGRLSMSEADIEAMCRFLSGESILAIFIRHSPFLCNQCCWPESLTELNRHTYATTLQPSETFDTYLKGIPQKLRWSVNFARRSGLSVSFRPLSDCPDSQILAFYQLYSGLMLQKQTSGYYLFSEQFFLDHARVLGDRCELAEIVDQETGRLLAAAYFLLDETGWVHYHLSAARPEAMKQQGMELLMASAIYRYGNSKHHALHLGGGHVLDESDGLSRFKAKFSTERLDFFCTKLVCDRAGYQRERDRMPLKNPALFLISDARKNPQERV